MPFKHCTKDTWVTRDGRKIKVADMEGTHVVNTYNMLIRWAQAKIWDEVSAAYSAMSHCHGDGALMACEQAAMQWDYAGPQGYCREYVKAFAAIEKRYKRIQSGKEKLDHRVYAF